jgi:hypothetical protein
VAEYESFEAGCLEVDGLALVEYALELQQRGCRIELGGASVGKDGHRRLQALFMLSWLGRSTASCSWDDIDDVLNDVDLVCCTRGACDATGEPEACSPGCAVAMHQFMGACGALVHAALGDGARAQTTASFEQKCLEQADPAFFLDAIEHAECEHPVYRLFVARADAGMPAVVAAIDDGTEVSLNGESQGTLAAGELWEGSVTDGDIFAASGPIYGVVRNAALGTYVMIPEWLRGTEFAIPNSRRPEATVYVYCLDVPCHVSISVAAGILRHKDLAAEEFVRFELHGQDGAAAAIVVSASADVVVAVGADTGADTDYDYMPVPPVAAEVFGVPSTVLSVATAAEASMRIGYVCSDDAADAAAKRLDLPAGGEQLEQAGWGAQYTGKACRFSAATVDASGVPRTFSAHGYGDGDGGDATPFLPPALFSTAFVAPIAWEWLSFVSDQPGTVTVGAATLELEGSASAGVYKAYCLGTARGCGLAPGCTGCADAAGPGPARATASSTVPVSAVLECAATDDEQLLYGRTAEALAFSENSADWDPDQASFRLFVARADAPGVPAVVASVVDHNDVYLNGRLEGTLMAGELWAGTVITGDIFSAAGPIYGVVNKANAACVMVPGRLRGTEFAIANSRRTQAHLYVSCLEVPCHVTIATSAGVAETADLEADETREFVVAGAAGASEAIVLGASADVVVAVADAADTDYMPVPPVAAELVGIASTHLSISSASDRPAEVEERCSEGAAATLELPGAGRQLDKAGYGAQYAGKACKYSSTTINARGEPQTIGAHGYGDGDGGDSVCFLPPALFSTDFVAPVSFEFLAFASTQPGAVTVELPGGDVVVELAGSEEAGVYKVNVGAGPAGTLISATVPVWAVLEDARTNDEQLLFGNMGKPAVNLDRKLYRAFVARADGDAAFVASVVDGNQVSLNGESQGTLQAGQVWEGAVSSGDIFAANGPIYGVVRTATGTHVMVPGRLRGREFAIPNSRRAEAHLYVSCLEVPCHVTVEIAAGQVEVQDLPAETFHEFVVAGAAGAAAAIVVSSSAPVVMAVANVDDTDYMPVPPVSAEQFGVPSTILSIATAGAEGVEVMAACSDDEPPESSNPCTVDEDDCGGAAICTHTGPGTHECGDGGGERAISGCGVPSRSPCSLAVPGAGSQLENAGYERMYTGKACRFSAATVDASGAPRTFSAHGYGDGDGGDATPFLPPALFSTAFVIPVRLRNDSDRRAEKREGVALLSKLVTRDS